MTVEILEGPAVYTTIKTCSGCKAKLKATEADFKVGNFDGDYVDAGLPGLYFTCPVCDTDVRVKDAPYNLIDRVRRNKNKKKETDK